MRLQHLVKVALFCGVLVALPGQTVRAQLANSTKFVQLLLLNEQKQITAENKSIATIQSDIAKLDAASNSRQVKSLSATISRLNRQLLHMSAELSQLAIQTVNTARGLTPKNTALINAALANLSVVQSLSARIGLGFTPASPSQ
jgi:hypothetical protein